MLDIPESVSYVEYIKNENITAIVISKTLMGFATSNHKNDFIALANEPDRFGWKKVNLTDVHSLLVKVNAEPAVGGMFADNLIPFISNKVSGKRGALKTKVTPPF